MIPHLVTILIVIQTVLAVFYTNDRAGFGPFNNASIYRLPANGKILVPDRSGFDEHVANVTGGRSNARAAAASQSEIMNICVGIASNPTRTKFFKDRVSCDIQGWTTLYTIQAFRNKDKFMAPEQMCVGRSNNPDRSMLFSGGNCNKSGWTHDFSFWTNQCPWFSDKCGGVYSHNMQVHVYQAFDPHRIMLAPGYDGAKHGWKYLYSIAYMAHYFSPSSKGYQLLSGRHNPSLVKRADISRATRSQLEAFYALIDCWTLDSVIAGMSRSIYYWKNCASLRQVVGNNDEKRHGARIDNQNAHTVLNAYGYPSLNIQLQMGGNTYGNLLIPVNSNLGAAAIRTALINSLHTGQVQSMVYVPDESFTHVPDEPGHIELPSIGALIALLGGAFMMIGGSG